MPTLTEKVLAVFQIDDPPAIQQSGKEPSFVLVTEFELDLRDWGVAYGVAYGIARGEDPYESHESVGERALAAAREVWAEYWSDADWDARYRAHLLDHAAEVTS